MTQMRLGTLLFLALSTFTFACTSASNAASGDDDDDDANAGTETGSSSGATTGGSSGGSGSTSSAAALSATTFVFTRDVGDDDQHLIAMDYATGDERVITTLEEDTVSGWNIDGASVSPDRTHVAIASHYGATTADLLATANIIWTLDVDGADFVRLTPPVKSEHAGDSRWQIDIRDPRYSPDGTQVAYDHGEGGGGGGYVAPWSISTAGGALPSLIDLPRSEHCSTTIGAAFQPSTGDLLVRHSVCQNETDEGYFLYPKAGGDPTYLIDAAGVTYDGKPSFSHDGAAFVYQARLDSTQIQSLFIYSIAQKKVVELVPGASGRDVLAASFAPDDTHLVYCVRENGATNLHVLDLTSDPLGDRVLTTDGKSCDPVF